MTRFLVDEDINNNIVRGPLRRVVDLDLVRVQDIGMRVPVTTPYLPPRRAKNGSS